MAEFSICQRCGEEKDADCFYERPHGLSLTCIDCEEELYDSLSEEVGAHMALFGVCMALNVPFYPEMLPPVDEFIEMSDRWVYYNDLIAERIYTEDGILGFDDGETNILHLFGKGLTQSDTAKFLEVTMKREANKPGTREQRERWGTEPIYKGLDMTTEVYTSLDRKYKTLLNRYKGQNDPQLLESIITVCKLTEISEYLLRVGDIPAAQKAQKMKDDLMASEQMRKKDEKPIEGARIDAMVLVFENAGLMEEGKFKTFPEVVKVFWERFFKTKKYRYSIDAADHMIEDYYNNARINADLATATILPGDLELHDDLNEFEAEKTEEEIKRERYAGLTPVIFEKASDDDDSDLDDVT